MSGYIGKIAAIVTANTSDFTSKLAGTKKDVSGLGESIKSTISAASNSATKSLNAIFTPLQKLQRALEGSTKSPLNLRTDKQVREMQTLVSLSEGLAKPLAAATRQFEQLSQQAQANFLPALILSQTAVKALQTQLEKTGQASGSGFEQARRQIEQTTQAVQRLAQAQQLASKTLTGNELQFRNPRLFQTLSAGAEVSQQAAALPASALQDGSIARQTNALKIYQDLAVAAEARIESLRLTPNIDPSVLKAAQADFERYATVAERAAARVKTSIAAANAPARADQRNFAITGQVQDFEQARRESQRLLGQVAQLPSGREAFSGRLTQLDDLVAADDINELEQVRRLIADIQSSLSERRRLDLIDQAQLQAARQLAESLERIRENADFVITGRPQNLSQVQSELNGIIGQLGQLTEAQRTTLGAGVTAVIGQIGLGNLDAAVEALATLRTEAAAAITVNVETQTATDRIRAIADAWDYAVRGIPTSAAQIDSEFQSLASRIGNLRIEDRLDLDPLIRDFAESVQAGEPLISQFQRLLTLRQQLDGIESSPTPPPPTPLGDRLAEQGRRRVEGRTGDLNLDATPPPGGGFSGQAQRDIDALATRVGAVRQQLETLPNSVRTQFIPALIQARDALVALQNAPGATVEQIENAANAVKQLELNTANASRFTEKLGESLSNRAALGQSASLEGLRATILSLGAASSGPVVAAFEALRVAKERAAASGDFSASRRQISQLEQEAINAVAAFSGLSAAQVRTQQTAAAARFGDVGRGGADKAALALNQLAFGIDDFFSAAAGAEQKIRAISNNITQLGFVAGGTTGLFIALGTVVGLQVALAISKFVFETDKADEALKALNAALEANQRNVEQLAAAYEKLADAIAGSVLSPQDKVRRDRQQQGEELTKTRQAVEEEAFASLSPEVGRVRGERELLKKRQQESNDIEERVRIANQIRENVARERELLGNRGSLEGGRLLVESADRQLAAQETRRNRAVGRRRLGSDELPGENVEELQREVEQARARRDAARRRVLPGATTSAQTREQLDALGGSLAAAQQAREGLVRALPPRTPGTAITRVDELDETIRKLKERIEVVSAVLGGQLAGELVAAQGKIQDSLTAAADSIDTLGIQSALGKERDKLSRELTAIADELAEVSDPARAAALKAQQDALEINATAVRSAAASAEQFASVLEKLARELSDTVLQEVEGRAGQARRDSNAAVGAAAAGIGADVPPARRRQIQQDIDRSVEQTAEARRRADSETRRAREGQQEFERRRRAAVQQFEAGALGGQLGAEAQQLVVQRDEAEAVLNSETATIAEQQAAAENLAAINAQLETLLQNSPVGRALAAFADRLDAASQQAVEVERQIQEEQASADRGRELSLTPGQRAGEQLTQELQDIRNFFSRAVEESTGLPEDVAKIRQKMNEALDRAAEDAQRQAAPGIFALGDAVQNAVLQGPSRAALQATDVSTVEGAGELNRLLRGDDAARDQDLVELQRQSKILEDMLEELRKAGAAGVAN
jgi:hypothetical protein